MIQCLRQSKKKKQTRVKKQRASRCWEVLAKFNSCFVFPEFFYIIFFEWILLSRLLVGFELAKAASSCKQEKHENNLSQHRTLSCKALYCCFNVDSRSHVTAQLVTSSKRISFRSWGKAKSVYFYSHESNCFLIDVIFPHILSSANVLPFRSITEYKISPIHVQYKIKSFDRAKSESQ